MIDKYIQFVILYIMAHTITISITYIHFYFISILVDKSGDLKNPVLFPILWITTYIILCILFIVLGILVPGKILSIGLQLFNDMEWKDNFTPFLTYISWLVPPMIISIKKNKEIKIAIKKRKETKIRIIK